jgi:predicted amidohydrolase
VKNTLIWIDADGEIKHRYQKLHLFDVEIEGGPVLRESKSVEKGSKIVPPFDTAVGKVGPLICFDVFLLPHVPLPSPSPNPPINHTFYISSASQNPPSPSAARAHKS